MVQIIATREIQYAGKRVLAGERFEATEKDAKIYVAVKRAALPGPVEPPASIKTMAAPEPVEPAPAPVEAAKEEAAPEAPPHPQTYSRRDMQAVGQTGQADRSPSSRQGRRQNRPTSTS